MGTGVGITSGIYGSSFSAARKRSSTGLSNPRAARAIRAVSSAILLVISCADTAIGAVGGFNSRFLINSSFALSIRRRRSAGGALINSWTRRIRVSAASLAAAPTPYALRYTSLTASRPLTAAGRINRLLTSGTARFQSSPISPSLSGSNGSQSKRSG